MAETSFLDPLFDVESESGLRFEPFLRPYTVLAIANLFVAGGAVVFMKLSDL